MLDRIKVERAFSIAANNYDKYAIWQHKIAKELLSLVVEPPSAVLDIGCGTGELLIALRKQFKNIELHGIDLAMGMVWQAQQKLVEYNIPDIYIKQCDMELIDYPEESFDLVISNLALQWLPHPESCFNKVAKVLRPNGRFLATTILPGSLAELEQAYLFATGEQRVEHPYVELAVIKQILMANGFIFSLSQREEILFFKTPTELLDSIRKIGAKSQPHNGLTKSKLKKLYDNLPKKDDCYYVTYKLLLIDATLLRT